MRNSWHLYEWLKQQYMRSGRIPTYSEARREFPELSIEEMGDGFTEFRETMKRYERGA